MSYHARIGMPLLIVTGRTGACGNTNRIDSVCGSFISSTIGTKSFPSAPRPCSHTTDASGRAPVSSSTQGRSAVMARKNEEGSGPRILPARRHEPRHEWKAIFVRYGKRGTAKLQEDARWRKM